MCMADRFRGNLTFFRNAFSDFIYQEAEHHEEHEDEEGHEEHELTEYNWVQGDARFRGWEHSNRVRPSARKDRLGPALCFD